MFSHKRTHECPENSSPVGGEAATSLFNSGWNRLSDLTSTLHRSSKSGERSIPSPVIFRGASQQIRAITANENILRRWERERAPSASSLPLLADRSLAMRTAHAPSESRRLDEERDERLPAPPTDRRTQSGSGRAVKSLVLLHTRR